MYSEAATIKGRTFRVRRRLLWEQTEDSRSQRLAAELLKRCVVDGAEMTDGYNAKM